MSKTVKIKATVAYLDNPTETKEQEWDYVEIDDGETLRQASKAMIDGYNDSLRPGSRLVKLVNVELLHTYENA